ncbi:transmembrane protein 208-like, partial [Stegodyphus dumicola]|uniref:transmembrane protein 208-like n=1 Tax=Stegodyphus dumicola TaxID=202533 RepID=UPI0015AF23D3
MAPQKGKQGTKGQKQIVEENKGTLRFYTIMAVTAELLYIVVMISVFWEAYTILYVFLTLLTVALYGGSLQFMSYMARASYSETGQLLDGGIDLNMESGIAEHLKDLIILTAVTQVLSLVSNYFWILWLL